MTARPVPFTVAHAGRNVAIVRIDVGTKKAGEWWFLIRGDAHHDNPLCRQDLERRHLEQARERGAGIIDVGDLFCAMQGKYDKRSSLDGVREEHRVQDYLGALVRTAADFYEPFAPNWIVLGVGNHETGVLKHNGFDLTVSLAASLKDRTGSPLQAGGYTGWVRFMFERCAQRVSRRLWYMHGYGGGGPVTKDMIQRNRQQVYVGNADIMVSGHTHDAWTDETVVMWLNDSNTIEQRSVHYIKTATYKDEYRDGHGGWHVETGKPPKPLGAWWLRFWWDGNQGLKQQIVRAD